MHDESRPPETDRLTSDPDALARHLAGESDPVEAAAVEAWLASNPLDAALVRAVKAHADRADASAAVSVDVESALARVRARMDDAGAATGPQNAPLSVVRGGLMAPARGASTAPAAATKGPRWGVAVLAVAATLLAAVAIRQFGRDGTVAGTERVVATQIGQRDSLTLSDGSTVVLAPGSTLTVAAGFDQGDRVVTLEGAAFFEVKHDAAHPFTVRSAGAEIRDIGTAFSVKTDAAGGVAVAVTHGIVAVRRVSADARDRVELHAGDRGIVGRSAVAVSRGIVTSDDVAWTRGQLSYRDASIAEVQADLKRWYGIDLRVMDSTLAQLTVTMPAQPDSARFISTMAALLGADVEQHGDTVIFRSAGRGTTP